jgi:anti-sigma regulatory factor (Ser/Thr protein kinase)
VQQSGFLDKGPTNRATPPSEFRLAISASPYAGHRARNAIRERFGELLSQKDLDDLLMVVTELVNNSVEHGPGKPITVTLVPEEDSIRGEVADQGNPTIEIPLTRWVHEEGRIGLSVVEGLTTSWAVHEGSTLVSFELPLDRD